MKNDKIFCIGLSRTGTTSLCEALDILGYKTLHFSPHLYLHPEVISSELTYQPARKLSRLMEWSRKKEIESFDRKFDSALLEKYDVFGDLPIPQYFEELDKKFPGSKFIYTYREEEKWLKSIKWMLEDGAILWSHGIITEDMELAAYNCYKYDREKLLESYRNHHARVMKYFADRSEDLLVINIDQERIDFRMICDFLKRESPKVPFPKSNASRKVTLRKAITHKLIRQVPFAAYLKEKIKSGN